MICLQFDTGRKWRDSNRKSRYLVIQRQKDCRQQEDLVTFLFFSSKKQDTYPVSLSFVAKNHLEHPYNFT